MDQIIVLLMENMNLDIMKKISIVTMVSPSQIKINTRKRVSIVLIRMYIQSSLLNENKLKQDQGVKIASDNVKTEIF